MNDIPCLAKKRIRTESKHERFRSILACNKSNTKGLRDDAPVRMVDVGLFVGVVSVGLRTARFPNGIRQAKMYRIHLALSKQTM